MQPKYLTEINLIYAPFYHNITMDEESLLQDYIRICTEALQANRERFPFSSIFDATINNPQAVQKSKVRILNDLAKPRFEIELKDNEIKGREIRCEKTGQSCCCDCKDTSPVWNVKASYLVGVISNPDEYIANPAKLNWDWMIADN